MPVFLLPKLMVDAYGGESELRARLSVGEIHYIFKYPDGALEVSTKDVDCTRVLVRDPTQSTIAPTGQILYRSLGPFGGVTHYITLPEAIERRRLRESFFVYPSTALPISERENDLTEVCVCIEASASRTDIRDALVEVFRNTIISIGQIDSRWKGLRKGDICRSCFVGRNFVYGSINLTKLDQRVLNWFTLNALARCLAARKLWGETEVDLWKENAPSGLSTAEQIDL